MSQQTESTSPTVPPRSNFDCIIVGAGHNGLATGLVLARNGRKVLVLEKNNYVGGMGVLARYCRGVVTRSVRVACSRFQQK